jgi:hypothetical protein
MIWEATVVVKERNGNLSVKGDYFFEKIAAEVYINEMRNRYKNVLGSAIVCNENTPDVIKHGFKKGELNPFLAGDGVGKSTL